ncbi:palmdelphin [Brachyistius frenatus]|uniref:palmdelphin n=1 Tax=Brachyistius frenatus TaxID=100188 RepID=UPI0037E75D9F
MSSSTFAMEISVEHDKKTGKSQVVSTATITPETLEERGMKVFDDGRKSVYALQPDGADVHNEAVGEMTLTEVEELLRQATDTKVSTEVQYHPPVYSVPYSGTSRPSTPRTPAKTLRLSPTPSPTQGTISSRNRGQILKEENLPSQDMEEQKPRNQTPCLIRQDSTSRVQRSGEEAQLPCFQHLCSQLHCSAKAPQGLTNSKTDVSRENAAALVSIKVRPEGMPAAQQPVYRVTDSQSPSLASQKSEVDPDIFTDRSSDFNRHSPFCSDDIPSVNLVNTLPVQLQSETITMIFMGYENAADEEDEDIQAELVIISNSEDDDDDDDDDDDKYLENESNREEYLSYHPEGYKSKVFQPKLGLAEVQACGGVTEDEVTNWDDLELHKPTFIHKPGKHSPYMQGRGGLSRQTRATSIWRR